MKKYKANEKKCPECIYELDKDKPKKLNKRIEKLTRKGKVNDFVKYYMCDKCIENDWVNIDMRGYDPDR